MVALDKVYIYRRNSRVDTVTLFQLLRLHGRLVPATFTFSFTRSGRLSILSFHITLGGLHYQYISVEFPYQIAFSFAISNF